MREANAAIRSKCIKILNVKRIISILTGTVMMLSMAGCNNREVTDTNRSEPGIKLTESSVPFEYSAETSYFSAEELTLISAGTDESASVISMALCGEQLAVMMRVINLSTGGLRIFFVMYDKTGKQTSVIDITDKLYDDSFVLQMTSDKDGNLIVFVQSAQNYKLYTFNPKGSLVCSPVLISFPDLSFYASMMSVDRQGNYYFSGFGSEGVNKIYVFENTGNLKYTIDGYNLSGIVYGIGDEIYVDGFGSEQKSQAVLFYPVDKNTGNTGTPIDVTDIFMNTTSFSGSSDLYGNDTTGIYRYDLDAKTKTPMILWNNTNIDQTIYGMGSQIEILSDDTIFVMGTDYTSRSDERQITVLARLAENPNIGKQILTLAGIGIAEEPAILSAVHEFNEANSKYRVVIKDYAVNADYSNMDTQQEFNDYYNEMNQEMYLDVLAGKGPDILINYSRTGTTLSGYESSGLLTDLYPLMEADENFDKENYLTNILEACEIDGHLYEMPLYFQIDGLIGAKSAIGDRSGWTVDEFNAFSESLPDGVKTFSHCTALQLLNSSLRESMAAFVNTAEGKAAFDSDAFRQLLNWAQTYGTIDNSPALEPWEYFYEDIELAGNGQLALIPCSISGPDMGTPMSQYGLAASAYGDALSFVGYPSPGENGPTCTVWQMMGITSYCQNPDAAWGFIKVFLSEDAQESMWFFDIPILKSALTYQIDLALHPEKIPKTDDAAGDGGSEPVPVSEESAQKYTDLVYSIHDCNDPDREILAIIEEEVPAFFAGQKSAGEVSAVIQNRVQILIDERQN